MLKHVAIGILAVVCPVGSLCQQKASSQHDLSENQGNQTALSQKAIDDQVPCSCTTPPPRTRWYSSLETPDWWVVIIAALTGAAVAWQSLETRRAAQAMRAANRASVQSQRARLSIQSEHRDIEQGHGPYRTFQLIATNVGQSIAEVFEVDTRVAHFGREIFKHLETMDFPEPNPNLLHEPHLLLPGARGQFAEVPISEIVEPGRESEIEEGRHIPVWYGWIMFKDFAGGVHRQRFFYMFSGQNRAFFEVGPSGWNSEG
jgi:hypothetical protein